ncbi:MAG: FIST C-terminal domain-containing protein [Oscillospiraceae bacterium]|nr:FIST C-terminal domain-containing protein [Oscillospiraceae bacterium]
MLKMFSAFTEEIDDVGAAVADILNQLDLDNSLMKNSIGLLHCYHEFIDSGVVKALSEKLPFEIAGITVPTVCMSGITSSMGLMLNILTGDDVNFVTSISAPLDIGGGNLMQTTEKMCSELRAKINTGENPPMLMTFAPFLHVLKINADEYVDGISGFFPNVPIFGAFSFSEEIDFSKCYTLYNGESYELSAVLIAITGNVAPSFLSVAIPEKNVVGELATVTKSSDNIIHEINNMSVEDYVISIGLIEQKGELEKLYSTPMIANLADGSTIVRVCIGGDGEGGAIMGGHVPVGAKIGFAMLKLTDIASTSEEITKSALEILDGKNIIVYSCMARLEFLGTNQREIEAQTICGLLNDLDNFCLAYVGGEVFPQKLSCGRFANHLHNFSLIFCVL